MEVLTIYVGQGDLAVVRHGKEGLVVDARIPNSDEVSSESVEKQLNMMLDGRRVPGLILTSFDSDHADPYGVDLILDRFEPDWVMYPKYYKDPLWLFVACPSLRDDLNLIMLWQTGYNRHRLSWRNLYLHIPRNNRAL